MSFERNWLETVMTQKRTEDQKRERDYFQKWLTEPKWQDDLVKQKAITVMEREKLRKEKEYMNELRYKMEEQLRLVAEWDKLKLDLFEQGGWKLFKLPQDITWLDVRQWCDSSLEPQSFTNGPGSFRNDWMIRYEQNQTMFALRWVG